MVVLTTFVSQRMVLASLFLDQNQKQQRTIHPVRSSCSQSMNLISEKKVLELFSNN